MFWNTAALDRSNMFTDYRPKCLYHYTGRDTGVKILDGMVDACSGNRCGFAFTDYRFLNDSLEFKWGLSIAKDWLRKDFEPMPKELRLKTIKLLEGKRGVSTFRPYILSFSQHCDSTVHWAAYTDKKDGGFSIGLSYSKLEKELVKFNNRARNAEEVRLFQNSEPILFGPCIYCKVGKIPSWRGRDVLAQRFIDVLSQAFAGVGEILYRHEIDFEKSAEWCAERVFQFASLVKSDEFAFEEEWRLVTRAERVENKEVSIIGAKPRVVPRRLNLADCLETIVISPHGDCERLKYLADFELERIGRKKSVRKSKSPYNGR